MHSAAFLVTVAARSSAVQSLFARVLFQQVIPVRFARLSTPTIHLHSSGKARAFGAQEERIEGHARVVSVMQPCVQSLVAAKLRVVPFAEPIEMNGDKDRCDKTTQAEGRRVEKEEEERSRAIEQDRKAFGFAPRRRLAGARGSTLLFI